VQLEDHHHTALLTAIAAGFLAIFLGGLGLIVASVLLVGIGLTLPRDSGSRLAFLLFGGTILVVMLLFLVAFGVGGEVQQGGH